MDFDIRYFNIWLINFILLTVKVNAIITKEDDFILTYKPKKNLLPKKIITVNVNKINS